MCKKVTINIIRDLDSIFGKRLEVEEVMKTVLWKHHLTTGEFLSTYILFTSTGNLGDYGDRNLWMQGQGTGTLASKI